jgi:N4-(beta-N-acetylglucosaminyl)-L-asparaginase
MQRREFLATGSAAAAISAAAQADAKPANVAGVFRAISSGNGLAAATRAVEMMKRGSDTLDAAVAGVNINEDDPNDDSVGYGGLPNEDGVVELDSSVMHGPTNRGGSVASLRNVKNPSKVAKLVMERTDHMLLVGEGALRFARAHGFKEENLLTEASREKWLRWKETLHPNDNWVAPAGKAVAGMPGGAGWVRPTGTIHVGVLNAKGEMSGCTSTSGLAFKIPGRVGDSPILGAGLYVDNDVGTAGSTGRGEANLLTCASFLIVELMRQGKSPEEACLEACKRIADKTVPRLRGPNGLPNFNVSFYALNRKGEHGSVAIHQGAKYAFQDGERGAVRECGYLFAAKK